MRIISEQDINRLVKKVLSEQTSIKIMGTEVKIDVNYDSKIYVGEYSYWVTARTCSVLDYKDCDSFENAHIKSFTKTTDGGLEIKTVKKTILLDGGQVNILFNKLKSGQRVVVHKDTFFRIPFEVRFER